MPIVHAIRAGSRLDIDVSLSPPRAPDEVAVKSSRNPQAREPAGTDHMPPFLTTAGQGQSTSIWSALTSLRPKARNMGDCAHRRPQSTAAYHAQCRSFVQHGTAVVTADWSHFGSSITRCSRHAVSRLSMVAIKGVFPWCRFVVVFSHTVLHLPATLSISTLY